MCGIAGIVGIDANSYRPALERMVAALKHRGPDGSGIHVFSDCALGHTRLSIVDLTTGAQPMLAADGTLAITFNGEIYGFRELRKELQDYQFRTTSDTEVILALHQTKANRMVQNLPGMFAFAIWDDHTRTLFAARDRFGEKPFYYAWGTNGQFLFASEIKSLLASGLLKPRLDHRALAHYLQYLYVRPGQTIYRNIFVLPPAHSLQLSDGEITVEKYWELPAPNESITEREAIPEFRRLFTKAVESQLIADVPVGAFLSGGLDSSSVVAVASGSYAGLKTFSFGFRDSIDELPYARELARRYQTDHIELKDDNRDIADLLSEMAQIYDEPFADSSNIPTYLISQAARQYGKVVITGDGGDELLAGYSGWYRPLWEMERASAHPESMVALMQLGARFAAQVGVSMPEAVKRTVRGAELGNQYASIAQAYLEAKKVFDDQTLRQFDLNGNLEEDPEQSRAISKGVLDSALRLDLGNYLPGDILVKTDRASMAHGLELRAPFLDVELASFCISLPTRLKMTAREDKWILRRSYENAWTNEIRRRGKCGFGAPVDRWLKHQRVAQLKNRILNDAGHSLFALINFEASRAVAARDNYQTWALLVLGLWLENGGQESL